MNSRQTIRYKEASIPNASVIGFDGAQQITNGLTAVVVDDNPEILTLAAAILEVLGYRVHMASDGSEALRHLKAAPCRLMLTDYEMPAITGYQLAKKVKSQFAKTRVLIMTGLCQNQVIELMRDQDVDGWLFKPFCLEQLKAMLSQIGLPGNIEPKSRLIA